MSTSNPKCTKGMQAGIISKKLYENELLLCKDLAKKNGNGCCWGKCKTCGVFPLLYKLYYGVLLEDRAEIDSKKQEEYKKLTKG